MGMTIAFCLGDGCGLGNMLQALPAVQALHELGNTCDLFLSGFMYTGITDAVRGQPYVRDIYENTYVSREKAYDVCIVSFLSDHRVKNAKKYITLTRDWRENSEYGQYCRVAKALGAKEFRAPRLNISDRNFDLRSTSIVIHAGCTERAYWERRKWTHYAELVDMLVHDGCHVYCCGSRNEIIAHRNVTAFNQLPIEETAALIQQCDLFISNDSGLMHLAAALRKKQIAIFTATSDMKSGPYYNPNALVIKPELSCYPCYGNETAWNQCRNWICRDAITIEHVHELITTLLHRSYHDETATLR